MNATTIQRNSESLLSWESMVVDSHHYGKLVIHHIGRGDGHLTTCDSHRDLR